MTPKQRREMVGCLNLLNGDTAGNLKPVELTGLGELPLTGNPRSPRKRRIPRKPSPAQIERFEALRARVMGIPESR